MQKVSSAYKKSMKQPLRGRGYIMVTFGVINQEAQQYGSVDTSDANNFTYYSNASKIFEDKKELYEYATLEENITRVDGSQLFLPRSSEVLYDSGVVGNNLVSEAPTIIEICTNRPKLTFKGMTIDWGENYATKFEIRTDSGAVKSYVNSKVEFQTEDTFEDVTRITIRVTEMRFPHSRVRIKTFKFGYGLIYKNDSVLTSRLQSYVSPICENVPQIDFSIKLNNRNKYFDIDNPESAINFLEIGQEMDISYGYEVSEGNIEWVKGQHLQCNSWSTDDSTATINAHDVFRLQEEEYFLGTYNPSGTSMYDLAVNVLEFGGIENYYVDGRLELLKTNNPMPRVTVKEALQIIANACRCVLKQDRSGKVIIQSSFIPDMTASSDNQTVYSQVENILNDDQKGAYAELGVDYSTVDGRMFFIPRGEAVDGKTINCGYVSESKSDADGLFSLNPKITIDLEAAYNYYSLKLKFGNSLPSGIRFLLYKEGELFGEYTVDSDIETETYVYNDFGELDKMVIEFTGTQKPYNRITLDNFEFGAISDFKFERMDMTSSPKAIRSEQVREVVVPVYTYSASTEEIGSLTDEEVNVSAGEIMMFYFSNASYGYAAVLTKESENEDSIVIENGVSIVGSSSYYVALQFNVEGTYTVTINGYEYKVTERNAFKALGNRGSIVTWQNPLISDLEMGADLAEWIGDYYTAPIDYEYTTRGNPELDANDIVYQHNDYEDDALVKVYDYTFEFNQAFKGTVKARKVIRP